jgi:RNA polymerase sigma-70 factor, ECF subfamily
LLSRIGEAAAAEEAYDRAIGLEADPAVRRFLQQRRNEVSAQPMARLRGRRYPN